MKAREAKRQRMVAKYAERKAALKKAALADAEGNIDYEALTKLQKLPKNASKVRLHNRCEITGRPKGYMRQLRREARAADFADCLRRQNRHIENF